jgi:hypothetical protein
VFWQIQPAYSLMAVQACSVYPLIKIIKDRLASVDVRYHHLYDQINVASAILLTIEVIATV